MSTDKKPLGFIFANITLLLSEARHEINQQVGHFYFLTIQLVTSINIRISTLC